MKAGFIFILLITGYFSMAQKVVASKSKTTFFSAAPLEDITASTSKGKSAINLSTGEIAFSIPINSFEFKRSLIQEHFNEKYMESEKFPKATFTGKIQQWEIDKPMPKALVLGILTIHGIANERIIIGKISYTNDKLIVKATFEVALNEFNIEVPSIMFQKIAKVVEVTILYEYPINEK